MNKTEINTALRKFVQKTLSPTEGERKFVTNIYDALQSVLGASNCLQIGSYPRFTAITPLHDLDVLFRIGPWPGSTPNPAQTLSELKGKIERDFKNPTTYQVRIELQTHSITISFLDGEETFFSVDVVPAYTAGVNEFKQDVYMVPELAIRRHAVRRSLYDELARSGRVMTWIKSDPRGYIEVAKLINERNEDFRKSAKFVKAWKWACKERNDNFKLKSFHIEQVITGYFSNNPQLEIYDAVLQFFQNLPRIIERAQIPDRADNAVFIDSYVNDLTREERQAIIEAGTLFLQKLQTLTSETEIGNLFDDTVKRAKIALTKGFPAIVTSRDQSFVPRSPWARRNG